MNPRRQDQKRFRNTHQMRDNRVTIRELAHLSGVSIGTVSRALNGYTDVNEETRERIIRLARELDYTPAAAARSLVTQRSHVVGVFLETGEGHPDLQHPFFHEVLVGLKGVDAEDAEIRRLTRSGLPCVGVDVALSGPATEYVMSDNPHGAALAV